MDDDTISAHHKRCDGKTESFQFKFVFSQFMLNAHPSLTRYHQRYAFTLHRAGRPSQLTTLALPSFADRYIPTLSRNGSFEDVAAA
jgi:hypothetical protein